jgi:PAS domain S-box-containing protein
MKRCLNIVHLENSLNGVTLAQEALQSGGVTVRIQIASTREEFIQTINSFTPDIILSELVVGNFHCSQALKIVQEQGLRIPFIILSSSVSEEMSLELLRMGIDDYVMKDRIGRLPFSVLRNLEKYNYKNEQHELLLKLSNEEKRFRTLLDNSTDALVVLDAQAQPTYVSPSFQNVLGYPQEEVLKMDIFSLSHPDDILELSNVVTKVLASPGQPIPRHNGRMLHKNGSWRWIEGMITNMLHEPSVNGIIDNFRDVTHQKASKEKILQLNRLYAFLSQVNRTLVHAPNAQILFREVCRIAIETGQFKSAWIGMTDTATDKMKLVESCGVSEKRLTEHAYAEHEQNILRAALQNQPYYLTNDIQQDFISERWKQWAYLLGYQSYMTLPLKRSGTIIGSFNLVASQKDFFTEAEITLLEEAAVGISFALDTYETDRHRVVAEEQLRRNERRLNQAQAIAHSGSWETDLMTSTNVFSNEFYKIFDLPTTEPSKTTELVISRIHPDDLDHVIRTHRQAIETLQPTEYHHRIILPSGQIRHIRVQTQIECNSDGEAIHLYGVVHDDTEIRQSQEALRESEYNLRAIFENTSEGFILADQQGTIKYFNSKAKYFYKIKTGKEIQQGSSLFDIISDNEDKKYHDELYRVLSGETLQYERLYNSSDAEKIWLSITITPVYENQQVVGLSLTMMDITERKTAQELLQRSESNLNSIINNTDALIYSLDTNLRYITYNNSMESLMRDRYGIDIRPGTDIRDSLSNYDPGSDLEWDKINARALSGEVVKFEKEFHRNGTRIYLKFSIHPIRKNNQVTGLSCFVNNITNEKLADEKFIKALEEKNVILESIGDCFLAVDKNWIVTYWNKQAEITWRFPKEEILGKCMWDVFPDFIDSQFYKSYYKAVELNAIQHFEAYHEKDKTWFEVTAYPSAGGLSIYLKNVTERKRSESQVLELNKNLNIYMEELIASNKGLEQFSYIVSHNLRAPVANIIGLAELAGENNLSIDVKEEFLKGILANVKRLDDVIADLNTILQIKREVSEKRELVDMQKLVNSIRSSIQNIIIQENVDIQTDFTEIKELFTLRSYLHSIFYNLIMNSIKYRRRDFSPVINIKSVSMNGQVYISFRDNGMGIDLHKKGKHIFGLYKRFHHHVEGKGMGLFMVKTQVEMLGGKINVTSDVNKGTEFRIELTQMVAS